MSQSQDRIKSLEYTNSKLLIEISELNMKLYKYQLQDTNPSSTSKNSLLCVDDGTPRKRRTSLIVKPNKSDINQLQEKNSLLEKALNQLAEKELRNLELREEIEHLKSRVLDLEESTEVNEEIKELIIRRDRILYENKQLEEELAQNQLIRNSIKNHKEYQVEQYEQHIMNKENELMKEIEYLNSRIKFIQDEKTNKENILNNEISNLRRQLAMGDNQYGDCQSENDQRSDYASSIRKELNEKIHLLNDEVKAQKLVNEKLLLDLNNQTKINKRRSRELEGLKNQLTTNKQNLQDLLASLDSLKKRHENEKKTLERKIEDLESQNENNLNEMLHQFRNMRRHKSTKKFSLPNSHRLDLSNWGESNESSKTPLIGTKKESIKCITECEDDTSQTYENGATLTEYLMTEDEPLTYEKELENQITDISNENYQLKSKIFELEKYKYENDKIKRNYSKIIDLYDSHLKKFKSKKKISFESSGNLIHGESKETMRRMDSDKELFTMLKSYVSSEKMKDFNIENLFQQIEYLTDKEILNDLKEQQFNQEISKLKVSLATVAFESDVQINKLKIQNKRYKEFIRDHCIRK